MITKKEIIEMQQKWADTIITIGKLKTEGKPYEEEARRRIETLYAVNERKILFKPTRAARFQFRHTAEGVLSYFTGNNPRFKEDKGFALNPRVNIRFENAGMILEPKRAIVMGNYFFTDLGGHEIKVEFTFGFTRLKQGMLKTDLHHSSMPYHIQ